MRTSGIWFAAVAVALGIGGCASQEEAKLLWRGTDAFDNRVRELPMSADEAIAHLIGKVRDRPEPQFRYFDKRPIFIHDDVYFFPSELSKIDVPLEGFYVNARTGIIEYRNSDVVIDAKDKALPPDPFSEVVVIE